MKKLVGAYGFGVPRDHQSTMPLQALPGYERVYGQDFLIPYPIGSFQSGAVGSADDGYLISSCAAYAGYGRNSFGIYPDNQVDTFGGAYYWPSKVVSTEINVPGANGIMRFNMHTENPDGNGNKALGAWIKAIWTPNKADSRLTNGRWTYRMRATATGLGFGCVPLLINNNNWPAYGEHDWPEGDLFANYLTGNYHFAQSTNDFRAMIPSWWPKWSDWHTYFIDKTPGRCIWGIDGVPIMDTGDRVGNGPLDFIIQAAGSRGTPPDAAVTATVDIDYITVDRNLLFPT